MALPPASVGHPPLGPSSPQTLAHGPFPLQQEALPDETEVIEDPTTEVGDSAPPRHPSLAAPTALGRASLKHGGAGAMGGAALPPRNGAEIFVHPHLKH